MCSSLVCYLGFCFKIGLGSMASKYQAGKTRAIPAKTASNKFRTGQRGQINMAAGQITKNSKAGSSSASVTGGTADNSDSEFLFEATDPQNSTNTQKTTASGKNKQSEKRKRISTGGSTRDSKCDSGESHECLTSNEKLSLILSKLTENEDRLKSFEEKLDIALDQSRVNELEKTVHDQDRRITVLEYKSLDLEARSRRKNLIFRGFVEDRTECCCDIILDFLRTKLEIADELAIDRAHRLGKYKPGLTRPIIVAFRDYPATEQILSSARKLARTRFGVSRDYPLEITNARKQLWSKYKALKSKYPSGRVKLALPAKLVVNGQVKEDLFPEWSDIIYTSRTENTIPHTSISASAKTRAGDSHTTNTSTENSSPRADNSNSSQSNFRPWASNSSITSETETPLDERGYDQPGKNCKNKRAKMALDRSPDFFRLL